MSATRTCDELDALLQHMTPERRDKCINVWNHDTVIQTHNKQSDADGYDNGRPHCLSVERNVFRIVNECDLEAELTQTDFLLLSISACLHDISRGITCLQKQKLSKELSYDEWCTEVHDEVSGLWVVKNADTLQLQSNEAAFVDTVVKIHNREASEFARKVKNVAATDNVGGERVHPQLCAAILKLADELEWNNRARPMDKEQTMQDPQASDVDKAVAIVRRMRPAWEIIPDPILVLKPVYMEDEQEQAVDTVVTYLEKQLLGQIDSKLMDSGLPKVIRVDSKGYRGLGVSTPSRSFTDIPLDQGEVKIIEQLESSCSTGAAKLFEFLAHLMKRRDVPSLAEVIGLMMPELRRIILQSLKDPSHDAVDTIDRGFEIIPSDTVSWNQFVKNLRYTLEELRPSREGNA